MEVIQYIHLFRRWAWLILLAAFVTGAATFITKSGQAPVYEASTTISIGRFIDAPNPNSSDIRTGIDLAQTYAQLATTFDVLQGTVEARNLPFSPDALRRMISTRILTGTSLLVISVAYTDPVAVADIANELANQLILQSPTNLTPEQQAQLDFAYTQITVLNDQLETSRDQLSQLDAQISNASSRVEIQQLTEQRNAHVDQINQASSTVAQFSATITALQQRNNALDIVESARIPTSPTGANILSTTLLGALVGAAVALGIVLFLEYLDDTIRTTEAAAQSLTLPILGAIARFGKKNDPYPERLIGHRTFKSGVLEGYGTVRTNLMFSTENESARIYEITSPGPSEGKSITAANLAVTLAQAGLQVLLIDCDLRRPKLHEIFELKNNVGLTTMLKVDPHEQNWEDAQTQDILLKCLQTTTFSKLWVITSGFLPPNPAELLSSNALRSWVGAFRTSPVIDVVLFDTPPSLIAPDSSVLAATSKAEVILVLEAGRTRRNAALKVKEQFANLGVAIRGVVLNRVDLRDEGYMYGYDYYYASTPARPERKTLGERFLGKHG